MSPDERAFAPAAARNREPILEVLRRLLPRAGNVLEVASGSGEHLCHFARALPELVFQPSDPDPEARASIAAWRAHTGLANLREPIALSADGPAWSLPEAITPLCAILAINLIHISPDSACAGLVERAAAHLPEGSVLYLYGPYRRGGAHTAESNARFDASLRARDPRWGVRDLESVVEAAARSGLDLAELIEMPANNLSVVLRRAPAKHPKD